MADVFEEWVRLHSPQLQLMPQLPESAYQTVHSLVSEQAFTAGNHIVLGAVEDVDIGASGLVAFAKAELPAGLCFLVDHAWPFTTLDDALDTLREMPALLQRVCDIVGPPSSGMGAEQGDEAAERAPAPSEAAPAPPR